MLLVSIYEMKHETRISNDKMKHEHQLISFMAFKKTVVQLRECTIH